jgi:CheY-like chemotaxis protein
MANQEIARKKVLVVDDSPVALETVRGHLEPNGFLVYTYDDPSSAYDHLEEHGADFSILILDLNFPGAEMSGLTLAMQARELLDLNIPTLFISGEASDDQKKTIRQMGEGYSFLSKSSLSGDSLYNACMSLINENRYWTEIGSVKKCVKKALDLLEAKPQIPTKEEFRSIIRQEQKAVCDVKSEEMKTAAVEEARKEAEEIAKPSSLASALLHSNLVRAIIGLLLIIGSYYGFWLRATWQTSLTNKEEQIGIKAQQAQFRDALVKFSNVPKALQEQRMLISVQGRKIDKLVQKVDKLNGEGVNP